VPPVPAVFPGKPHEGWSAEGSWVVSGTSASTVPVVFVTTDIQTRAPKTVQLRLNPVAEFQVSFDATAKEATPSGVVTRKISFTNAVSNTGTLNGGSGSTIDVQFSTLTGSVAAGTDMPVMYKIPATDQLADLRVDITGTLATVKRGTATLSAYTEFVYGTDYYMLGSDQIASRVYEFKGYASDSEQRKKERVKLTGTNISQWIQSTEQGWLPQGAGVRKYIADTGTDPLASRIFYINSGVPSTGVKSGIYGIPADYMADPFRFNTGSSASEWNIFFTPKGGIEGDLPVYTINLTPVAEISVDFYSTLDAADRSTYRLMNITGTNGEWSGVIPTSTLGVQNATRFLGFVTTGTGGVEVSGTGQITVKLDTGTAAPVTPAGSGTFASVDFNESARYTVMIYPDVATQKTRANEFFRKTLSGMRGEYLTTGTLAVNPVAVGTDKIITVYYYGADAVLSPAATGVDGVFLSSQWEFTGTASASPKKDFGVLFTPVGSTAAALDDWDKVVLRQVAQFRAIAGETNLVLGANLRFANQSGSSMSIIPGRTETRARIDIVEGGTTTGTITSSANAFSLHTGTTSSTPLKNSQIVNLEYQAVDTVTSQEYLVQFFSSKEDQEKKLIKEAGDNITKWITDTRLSAFGLAAKQDTTTVTEGVGTGSRVVYYLQEYSTGTIAATGVPAAWSLKSGSTWAVPTTVPVTSGTSATTVILQKDLSGLVKADGSTKYNVEFNVNLKPVARYQVQRVAGAVGTISIYTDGTVFNNGAVVGQPGLWSATGLDHGAEGFIPLGKTTAVLSDGTSFITVHDISGLTPNPESIVEQTGVFDAKSLQYRIFISRRNTSSAQP